MDMILDLRLNPREICTAQQKGACLRNGKIRFFTKRRVADSNKRIRKALEDALECAGVETIPHVTGNARRPVYERLVRDTISHGRPISLEVVYFFPFPSGTPKRCLVDNTLMTEKPDVDNLNKSVQDELTKLRVWHDDSQIAVAQFLKFRTTGRPRMAIRIRTADDCIDAQRIICWTPDYQGRRLRLGADCDKIEL